MSAPDSPGPAADVTALLEKYPGLLSEDESVLAEALVDVRTDSFLEGEALLPLAPWLLRFFTTCPESLRERALETWALVLREHVTPEDLESIAALLDQESFSADLRRTIVVAIIRLGGESAEPLLHRLLSSPVVEARYQIANSLRLDGDADIPHRRALLTALTKDPSSHVRAEAIRAFSLFRGDPEAMQYALELADTEAAPEARAAALQVAAYAHAHGHLDRVLALYQAALTSSHVELRAAVSVSFSPLPTDPRVAALVEALLADPSPDVRARVGAAGAVLSGYPHLAPLFQRAAEHDPDDRVRAAAAVGRKGFLPAAELVAYLRARLAADPTSFMHWSVLTFARHTEDKALCQDLLQDLSSCPHLVVAEAARALLQMR